MRGHIGIVACSVEGAALCFREIAAYAEPLMGEHDHPQVTLSCIALHEWMPAFERGDYPAIAQIMLRETEIVARAGAGLAICPDNSAHLAFPWVLASSPIPWLHIAEVVAGAARQGGYRHAALLGTRFTMTGAVYPQVFARFGLQVSAPATQDQQGVDRVIFQELVKGLIREDSRVFYNEVVQRMKSQGCDCVILGCTEIPLLVRAADCPLPCLDSTRLLARAAVDVALGKAPLPNRS